MLKTPVLISVGSEEEVSQLYISVCLFVPPTLIAAGSKTSSGRQGGVIIHQSVYGGLLVNSELHQSVSESAAGLSHCHYAKWVKTKLTA